MREQVRQALEKWKRGAITEDEVIRIIAAQSVEAIGYAQVDHQRSARQGFPEVVFCQGKSPAQVAEIVARLAAKGTAVLATRADAAQAKGVRAKVRRAVYHADARVVTIAPKVKRRATDHFAMVVTAGTSDIPVAKEAALTIEAFGHHVETLFDVGVAGIHRILRHATRLAEADVVVVAAGMEGALPSVVGGLVSAPVIAVPTSIGYGASFNGVAALLGMLNTCSSNVTAVNIDNGFGAGFVAGTILNRVVK